MICVVVFAVVIMNVFVIVFRVVIMKYVVVFAVISLKVKLGLVLVRKGLCSVTRDL